MGTYSELDLEQRYGDDPFGEAGGIPAAEEDDPFSAFMENNIPVKPADTQSATEKSACTSPQNASQPARAQSVEVAAAKSQEAGGKAAKAATAEADEDVRRKAHEESEAKRKAEWEARQQQKKAIEKEQLDRLAAMSDDEVMAESMKRVGADTEKLTRRNMKECVTEHIQTLCLTDPAFARKAAHPRKNMIHCFQFISHKSWEYVQDELKANGIQPGSDRQGYGCDIPDDLCYQWAEDYFNDPNAKEDQEEEEEFIPKPFLGRSASRSKNAAKKKPEDKASTPAKKPAEKKPAKTSDQITIGGFAMPEEKAG